MESAHPVVPKLRTVSKYPRQRAVPMQPWPRVGTRELPIATSRMQPMVANPPPEMCFGCYPSFAGT